MKKDSDRVENEFEDRFGKISVLSVRSVPQETIYCVVDVRDSEQDVEYQKTLKDLENEFGGLIAEILSRPADGNYPCTHKVTIRRDVSPKVYISGALTVPDDLRSKLKVFYEEIGEVCIACGCDPYLPHQHTDPVEHADVAPPVVYEIDEGRVASSDLVIAYAGQQSSGVGMEIEIARRCRVPVLLVYEESKLADGMVSRIVLGNPAVCGRVTFSWTGEGKQPVWDGIRRVLEDLK